jgi:6-pyruvoyltetrahydropterin/6-carboxytetrahydropterin synthase
MYVSTKTYGHELGLSCAFRQWRAESHCNKLHGYAISVKLTFEADTLDHRNWVMDFGGLKPVKARLQELFDHTIAVDALDPCFDRFWDLDEAGLARVVTFQDGVGCEAFAEFVWRYVHGWLEKEGQAPRVRIRSVEVREHGANSAIYEGF